jgi:hypothetical protein
MRALLDTNFLMIPGEFKVDVISELVSLGYIEFFTLDLVVRELEKFSTRGWKVARHARIALELVRNCSITVLETKGDVMRVDDEILRLARTKNFVICTQDKELMKKVEATGMRFITLRQKKYLVESGEF